MKTTLKPKPTHAEAYERLPEALAYDFPAPNEFICYDLLTFRALKAEYCFTIENCWNAARLWMEAYCDGGYEDDNPSDVTTVARYMKWLQPYVDIVMARAMFDELKAESNTFIYTRKPADNEL
jgi:hypothetical protein